MRFKEKIENFYKKNKQQLTMGIVTFFIVLILYTVFNLIMWNTVSITYALSYAFVALILYFIAQRFLKYIVKKKEGVIEKHDNF